MDGARKSNESWKRTSFATVAGRRCCFERNSAIGVVTIRVLAPQGGALSDMALSTVMRRMNTADVKAGRAGYIDRRSTRPAVPDGLRSTFRDWAAEQGFDHVLAELSLAHQVGNEAERAYRRTDLLERRRAMMEAWSDFVQGRQKDDHL